jgi:hypothetical protein
VLFLLPSSVGLHWEFASESGVGLKVGRPRNSIRLPGKSGMKGNRGMSAKEELLKNDESIKDQPAASELENKTEELKREEAEKIVAAGQPPTINYH